MKPTTQELVDRAERLYAALCQHLFLAKSPNARLGREHRTRVAPDYSLACRLARDCARNCLSAWIEETMGVFMAGDDVTAQLIHTLAVKPEWHTLQSAAASLDGYVNWPRIPGDSIEREQAANALRLCDSIRQTVRAALALPAD